MLMIMSVYCLVYCSRCLAGPWSIHRWVTPWQQFGNPWFPRVRFQSSVHGSRVKQDLWAMFVEGCVIIITFTWRGSWIGGITVTWESSVRPSRPQAVHWWLNHGPLCVLRGTPLAAAGVVMRDRWCVTSRQVSALFPTLLEGRISQMVLCVTNHLGASGYILPYL